jgi:hypothetical protein
MPEPGERDQRLVPGHVRGRLLPDGVCREIGAIENLLLEQEKRLHGFRRGCAGSREPVAARQHDGGPEGFLVKARHAPTSAVHLQNAGPDAGPYR